MLRSKKADFDDSTAACRTVAANFKSGEEYPEAAILFDLLLEPLKLVADEFRDLAATKTRHVDVIALQLALVIMALAIDVHQIEFVDQPLPLQQAKRSINRAAVDTRIKFLRLAKNLAGVKMFAGGFHHAENGAALLGHADTALGKVGL
jgi:hypothetical protein